MEKDLTATTVINSKLPNSTGIAYYNFKKVVILVSPVEDGYRAIIDRMKHPTLGITLKDRRWLFKDYPKVFISCNYQLTKMQCFTGTEAVNWLMNNVEFENKYPISLI